MNDSFPVFVSAVTFEGRHVVVWGQRFPESVKKLEMALPSHCASGWVMPPSCSNVLKAGMKCFTVYNNKYVRVVVFDVKQRNVVVRAVDYGVEFTTNYGSLMLGGQHDPYLKEPFYAEKFVVSGVSLTKVPSSSDLARLESKIVCMMWSVIIVRGEVGRTTAIIHNGHTDLKAIVMSTIAAEEIFPEVEVFEPEVVPERGTYSVTPPMADVLNQAMIKEITKSFKKEMGLDEGDKNGKGYISPLPLALNSTVDVMVTDASEGPWFFSVQKFDDNALVADVAERLQKMDKVLLRTPIALGQPCLAFCSVLHIYARAIAIGVKGNKVNVNFVDYGCNQETNAKEIFELPSWELRTPILSRQFNLSGLNETRFNDEGTKEMILLFQEIVTGARMLLKVLPNDDGCVQAGELFQRETNVNIKKIINARIKLAKLKYTASELPAVGTDLSVFIAHLDNFERFYIHVNEDVTELQEIIQELAKTAKPLHKDDVKTGLPCLALFTDEQWYRGRIQRVVGSNLEVFFVDYGNSHIVTISSVLEIPPKMVATYPMLGVPCSLDGFDKISPSELKGKLTSLLSEDVINIRVTNTKDDTIVVKIFKNGNDIFSAPKIEAKPVNNDHGFQDFRHENANAKRSSRSNLDEGGDNSNWRSDDDKSTRKRYDDRTHWRDENADSGGRRNYHFRDSESNTEGFRKPRENDRGGFRNRNGNTEADTAEKDWGARRNNHFKDSESNAEGFRKPRENDRGGCRNRNGNTEADTAEKDWGARRNNHFKDSESNGEGFRKPRDNDRGGFRNRNENAEVDTAEKDWGGRWRGNDDDKKGFKNREDDGAHKDLRDGSRNYPRGGYKQREDGESGFQSEPAKKFGDSDRRRRQPVRFDERVSAGETFPTQSFSPGESVEVMITCIVSAKEFYIQTQANKTEFINLMNEMQVDYSNKFAFKKTEPPQESDVVIARYAEDNTLYRGSVIASEPITVRFTDYGNVAEIRDDRDVYPVMKKYAEMPAQAVKCTLKGIQPTETSTGVDDVLFGVNWTCTFHEEIDGTYVVSLNDHGKDLAAELISMNLASPESDSIDVPQPTSSVQKDPEFAKIDRSLLPGQVLVAPLPYIFGVEQFFVHLFPEAIPKMESLMADYLTKMDKTPLSKEEIQENGLCLACVEPGVMYRGRILGDVREDMAHVQFIDYGDDAEILCSNLFRMPDQFTSIPALAFECRLHGNTSDVTEEAQNKFKDEFEQSTVIIVVQDVLDDKLSLVIYDLKGKKIDIQVGVNDAPVEAPIPTLPLLTHEATVEIIDFTGSSSVIIRLPETLPPDVGHYYGDITTSQEVELGLSCAVQTTDGSWHRGIRVSEKEVYLVDSGRTEGFTLIRTLVEECRSPPSAACEVTASWLFSGACRVTITRNDGRFVIEPVEKLAIISHIDSANDFFVSPPGVAEIINSILLDTFPGELPNDEIFAARFPTDEQWYRAELVNADMMTVKFIDYGNSCDVTEFAPLPSKLKGIRPLAVAIHLEGTLPETALDDLQNLQNDETQLSLITQENGTHELFVEGLSLTAKLLRLMPIAVGDTVFISYTKSLSEVYVQHERDLSLLDELPLRLKAIDEAPLIQDVVQGQLVAAKYNEDGEWYRARVTGDQIFFIDHGNSEEITELRSLPDDLLNIPPLAERVSLALPIGCKWTENAYDIISTLIECELQVLQISDSSGGYVIHLFEVDSDIGRSLFESADISNASTEPALVVDSDESGHNNDSLGRSLVDEIICDVVSTRLSEDGTDAAESCEGENNDCQLRPTSGESLSHGLIDEIICDVISTRLSEDGIDDNTSGFSSHGSEIISKDLNSPQKIANQHFEDDVHSSRLEDTFPNDETIIRVECSEFTYGAKDSNDGCIVSNEPATTDIVPNENFKEVVIHSAEGHEVKVKQEFENFKEVVIHSAEGHEVKVKQEFENFKEVVIHSAEGHEVKVKQEFENFDGSSLKTESELKKENTNCEETFIFPSEHSSEKDENTAHCFETKNDEIEYMDISMEESDSTAEEQNYDDAVEEMIEKSTEQIAENVPKKIGEINLVTTAPEKPVQLREIVISELETPESNHSIDVISDDSLEKSLSIEILEKVIEVITIDSSTNTDEEATVDEPTSASSDARIAGKLSADN